MPHYDVEIRRVLVTRHRIDGRTKASARDEAESLSEQELKAIQTDVRHSEWNITEVIEIPNEQETAP